MQHEGSEDLPIIQVNQNQKQVAYQSLGQMNTWTFTAKNSTKQELVWGELYGILFIVGLFHVLLLLGLNQLWQQNVDNKGAKKKQAAIKSYLHTSPNSNTISNPNLKSKPLLVETQISISSSSKEILPQEDESSITQKVETFVESSDLNVVVPTNAIHPLHKQDHKQDANKKEVKHEAEKTHKKDWLENRELISQAEGFRFDDRTSLAQRTAQVLGDLDARDQRVSQGSLLDDNSLAYLQQQQASRLSQLAEEQAALATSQASLSDMTPAPHELNVPPSTEPLTGLPQVHGQLMAPNRIVQKGDFCYRMIKTPTQINPNAEIVSTIGYRCSADEDKKNVQNLINQRLKQQDVEIN
ncbi:hypothetical protein [uncultured Shewanella sp.]|uniref:hypothetical protein n=1 Tax=uncultured Shewanella sp. TaxID=173975 RepID=UPI0026031826|nr:hypothetical protein [uncultured Shewanella sp.]